MHRFVVGATQCSYLSQHKSSSSHSHNPRPSIFQIAEFPLFRPSKPMNHRQNKKGGHETHPSRRRPCVTRDRQCPKRSCPIEQHLALVRPIHTNLEKKSQSLLVSKLSTESVPGMKPNDEQLEWVTQILHKREPMCLESKRKSNSKCYLLLLLVTNLSCRCQAIGENIYMPGLLKVPFFGVNGTMEKRCECGPAIVSQCALT